MIIFLSSGIIVWMLYEVMKRCVENGKVHINHIFCFTAGLFYYGILPLLIFEFDIQFDDYVYHNAYQIYHTLLFKSKLTYIGILYLIFGCFVLGHKLSIFKIGAIKQRRFKKSFYISEKLWYFPMLFLGIYCIYLNRDNLLKGYTDGHNSFKGMYSTFLSLNFSLYLLYIFGKVKQNKVKNCLLWGGGGVNLQKINGQLRM